MVTSWAQLISVLLWFTVNSIEFDSAFASAFDRRCQATFEQHFKLVTCKFSAIMSGSQDSACSYGDGPVVTDKRASECKGQETSLSSWSTVATSCFKVSYCWFVLSLVMPSASFCTGSQKLITWIQFLFSFYIMVLSLLDVISYTCWISTRGHLLRPQDLARSASPTSRPITAGCCLSIHYVVIAVLLVLRNQFLIWKTIWISTCSVILFLMSMLVKSGPFH